VTNGDGPPLSEQIAQRGREVVVERLRAAFARHSTTRGGTDLDPARVENLVQDAASRAGEALRRRSLAEAAMEELGIGLSEALAHPVLADAEALIDGRGDAGLPPSAGTATSELAEDQPSVDAEPARLEPRSSDRPEPSGEPVGVLAGAQALRLSVVHLGGIETLYQGDDDLELRLSEAGLDVLKRSDGAAIGRLEWSEIETVALRAPKRGLRSRRRSRELHVSTGRGQAQFELPGLTDQELHEYLEPTLARLHGTPSPAGVESDSDTAAVS
jgi:hypothetical protein